MALTTNRSFDIPARGGSSGTWDDELRDWATRLDTMLGGVLTTSLSSSNVSIASTAYNYGVLRFTGTISANITITLPAKACTYIVENLTTGAGFYVRFTTGSGEVIACPQGMATDILVDGTNVRFRSLPAPGTFWDYGGATAPPWIAACTTPPWLACDGSTAAIATYPHLAAVLGTAFGGDGVTTFGLPDTRNRARVPLMASSALLTSAVSGVDGATRGAAGGTQSVTIAKGNLPTDALPQGTVAVEDTHYHFMANTDEPNSGGARTLSASNYLARVDYQAAGYYGYTLGGTNTVPSVGRTGTKQGSITAAFTGTGLSGAAGTAISRVQPTIVHGLTFIKT